jgi:hypothetical protein
MDIGQFWDFIEKSRKESQECEEQAEALIASLSKLKKAEIVAFKNHFNKCLDDAYRWDLWAVAYIIHGGCSDDSFEYFRCWLIGQGRQYFEAALASPEKAADNAEPGEEAECEDLLYAAVSAYESVAGHDEMPSDPRKRPSKPAGEQWDEDDVGKLYPKLAKKFEFGDD